MVWSQLIIAFHHAALEFLDPPDHPGYIEVVSWSKGLVNLAIWLLISGYNTIVPSEIHCIADVGCGAKLYE